MREYVVHLGIGANLDDPGVESILEAAEALGASVFVHPWDMAGQERMQRYWLPWLLGMPTETAMAITAMKPATMRLVLG